ncbi:MAG: hypothetical protein ACYC2P_13365 [Paludibacteraceae bacterium]
MKPVYIVDEIGLAVAQVSANLLAQLQAFDATITGVHYQYGHPIEIIETLKQMDEAKAYKFSRYPFVGLFQDFPEDVGEVGFNGEVTLHMIIARFTTPTYKAAQRYEFNFKPVLYPIYFELLKQLNFSKAFQSYTESTIQHTKIDRLYWGREGLYKNEGNIFNDFLDCIEIRNLKLKTYLKIC